MNIYSRRDLLKGLAATGLGAMALGRRLFGQQPAHGRIDVHHHYRLPGMKLLVPDDGWTPARSVEQMDRFGIATAVVSCPVIYSLYDGTPQARELVRQRIRRKDGARLSPALWLLCRAAFPGSRGQLKGNRVRLRHFESRRDWVVH